MGQDLSDIFPVDMGLATKTLVGAAVVLLGLALVSSVAYMNNYFSALVDIERSAADLDSNEHVERPELEPIRDLLARLDKYTENTKVLSKTWRSLRLAYRLASTSFTFGILAFSMVALFNLYSG